MYLTCGGKRGLDGIDVPLGAHGLDNLTWRTNEGRAIRDSKEPYDIYKCAELK